MSKKALIFGISGQDGSYLTEYLLSLDYEVHGIVRRHSVAENQFKRLAHIRDKIKIRYGDIVDVPSIYNALSIVPDEIYNLAAQSHVRVSSEMPVYTTEVNAVGTLNLLDAMSKICPAAKFYQASSSEIFGNSVDPDGFQRETTPMTPVSPYGCSKLFAYGIVRHYRNAYKLHAVNGILFNHESPRRGLNFVTNKVVKNAVQIKLGQLEKLELGNMHSYRDWGHAADYVKAMHMMLAWDQADDFVVATGEARSVTDLCEYVFSQLGLHYADHVSQNPVYCRPEELNYLKGDSSKIRETLGWKPEYTFQTMLDEMIEYWMRECSH